MPRRRSERRSDAQPPVMIRRAALRDLDALLTLERQVFATDQISRRSMRRLLAVRSSVILVTERDGAIAGTAVILFRRGSALARLYSIAVAPACSGQGLGAALLAATEREALARRCSAVRLEVHESNANAIARYRKSGYREFGRHAAYYEDGGDALRFEKHLT